MKHHRGICALVAAFLATTPLLFAASARADVDEFVSDLTSIGVHHPQPGQLGRMICGELDDGNSHSAVASMLANASVADQGSENGITLSDARQVVSFAVNDMCPGE